MTITPDVDAPLKVFRGAPPPAPSWFREAIATPVETIPLAHDGVDLELLAWGKRGAPGLLLLHGSRAHAHWWSPLAALLAERFRVASLSWSGMGQSGWRSHYSVAQHADEGWAAAHAAGLFEGGRPVVAAHSYGGGPALIMAEKRGEDLAGLVIVDTIIEERREPMRFPPSPMPKIYPSIADALARYRLAPPQPCPNLFYLDWVARHSLRRLPEDNRAGPGFMWSFDPLLWDRLSWHDKWSSATQRKCPMAMLTGEDSLVVGAEQRARLQHHMPPGTVFETFAGAGHHILLDRPLELAAAMRRISGSWLSERAE